MFLYFSPKVTQCNERDKGLYFLSNSQLQLFSNKSDQVQLKYQKLLCNQLTVQKTWDWSREGEAAVELACPRKLRSAQSAAPQAVLPHQTCVCIKRTKVKRWLKSFTKRSIYITWLCGQAIQSTASYPLHWKRQHITNFGDQNEQISIFFTIRDLRLAKNCWCSWSPNASRSAWPIGSRNGLHENKILQATNSGI